MPRPQQHGGVRLQTMPGDNCKGCVNTRRAVTPFRCATTTGLVPATRGAAAVREEAMGSPSPSTLVWKQLGPFARPQVPVSVQDLLEEELGDLLGRGSRRARSRDRPEHIRTITGSRVGWGCRAVRSRRGGCGGGSWRSGSRAGFYPCSSGGPKPCASGHRPKRPALATRLHLASPVPPPPLRPTAIIHRHLLPPGELNRQRK